MLAALTLLGSVVAAWWAFSPEDAPALAATVLVRDVPGGGERYETLLHEPGRLERLLSEPADSQAVADERDALRRGRFEPLPAPDAEQLAGLIAALRDDDIVWNAAKSSNTLRRLLLHGATRDPVLAALVDTLDSMDFQQRYLVAYVLMGDAPPDPPERLIKVAVDMLCEGRLQNGAWGMEEIRRIGYTPQSRAIRFLVDHAEQAEAQLLSVLGRDWDHEARFLASFALAYGGRDAHVDRVAPSLIRQLSDNDIPGDAHMAMNALMKLPPERVVSWLRMSDAYDDQFLRSRRLLILALQNGGDVSERDLAELNAVSSQRQHPLQEWRLGRYQGWR